MSRQVPPEAERELARARKALAAARTLREEGLLEDALSRSYYAVLHAARALLVSEGINPSSHEAVKRLFGLHIVKEGGMDAQYAHILREEQDDRALADYDVAFVPEEERVDKRILDAEKFLVEASRLLAGDADTSH